MAARASIVEATLEHASWVAQNIRAEDAAEVKASGGYTPLEAIADSIRHSTVTRAVLVGDEVLAVFGVAPVESISGVGVAWAITSKSVNRYPRAFWRACLDELPRLLQLYPTLINAVDARYSAALRWVDRLGFSINPPEPFGAMGLPFCKIYMRRSSDV